jgi:Lipase (class 3)
MNPSLPELNLPKAGRHGMNFSLRNAVALAQASAAAYDEATLESALGHVRLFAQEDCLLVAFRGTHHLQDILVDADAARVHLPGTTGSVHAGFWRSVGSLIEPLVEALQPPGDLPERPLFITGHSKGGAEAMLAAYLLTRKLHPARIAGVYTFDQPRLFDAGGRAAYDALLKSATWRIVNGGDAVPQLPCWHWGYRHAGNEVFLPDLETSGLAPRASGLLVNPAWDITFNSKFNAYLRAWRRRRDVLIADHFITEIQARLEQEEQLRASSETSNPKSEASV